MSGYTITEHNPAKFTDDEIAEGVALGNKFSEEATPEDPPTPVEAALAAQKTIPERVRRRSFRVRDDSGDLVASAGFRVDPEHDDNPDIMWVGPSVLAEHRRRGVGSRLLAELVALARVEGRTRFVGGTNSRVPAGEAFAVALGAESKQREHVNQLLIADVDRAQLEKWRDEGPSRAADYELLTIDGRIPDEYADAYVDLVLVMNTAPRDDLKVNDFTFTVAELREGETQRASYGGEYWAVIACRKSDGGFAGFHDMGFTPWEPETAWVNSTGVRPEHRGHALGKWLKAAMTLRVMGEKPAVTAIRTGNADSNDAMLGINREMGYKPFISATTWEISVDEAAAWLTKRGVPIPAR